MIIGNPITLGGSGKSKLPEGYTELPYIESTGTQYIDTGFKPNQNTRVVCKAICKVDGSTNWLFAARESASSKTFGFAASTSDCYIVFYNTGSVKLNSNLNSDGIIEVDCNKGVTTLTANGLTGSVTGASGTFASDYNLVLFGGNTKDTVTCGSVTIYSCQIYDNETLVRDFVPCTNESGEVGLYDLVNKVFYGNAGSGVFYTPFSTAPVLLWTNASPTSSFPIQIVAVNGSGRSGYIVESRYGTTISHTSKSFVNIGSPAVAGVMNTDLNGLASREIVSSSNSEVRFGRGYDEMGYYNDNSCIPIRIWGVNFTI